MPSEKVRQSAVHPVPHSAGTGRPWLPCASCRRRGSRARPATGSPSWTAPSVAAWSPRWGHRSTQLRATRPPPAARSEDTALRRESGVRTDAWFHGGEIKRPPIGGRAAKSGVELSFPRWAGDFRTHLEQHQLLGVGLTMDIKPGLRRHVIPPTGSNCRLLTRQRCDPGHSGPRVFGSPDPTPAGPKFRRRRGRVPLHSKFRLCSWWSSLSPVVREGLPLRRIGGTGWYAVQRLLPA